MSGRNEGRNRTGNKHGIRKNAKRSKALNSGKKLESQKPLKVDAYLQLGGVSGEGG